MRHHCQAAMTKQPTGQAKRCVVLWMQGGPSQLDTFDPKPGTSTGGEFNAIATAVPGLGISEVLPEIAKHMDKLSVLRNVTSTEGEHLRGQYYLHTGYPFVPSFPRPAMGAVVSHETPPTDFPRYVTIGSRGFGPAYMGLDHAPYSIENPEEALELLRNIRRRKSRLQLLQDLGEAFDGQHRAAMLERRRTLVTQIERLVSTPFVEALQLDQESSSTRRRYGDHEFGKACLLARRMLDVGVNSVEVQHDGWDTHQNNFPSLRRLCAAIDRPWSALLEDLQSAGTYDETLVLWMGEFGRTPLINANRGRDHFPRVTPVVIGGGPIARGTVVGKTNKTGTQIEGDAYKVADLFATIFDSLGIDPAQEFLTSFGSPTAATDGGRVIRELT
jgi:hypothetical protein